jgi:hypothetical protein
VPHSPARHEHDAAVVVRVGHLGGRGGDDGAPGLRDAEVGEDAPPGGGRVGVGVLRLDRHRIRHRVAAHVPDDDRVGVDGEQHVEVVCGGELQHAQLVAGRVAGIDPVHHAHLGVESRQSRREARLDTLHEAGDEGRGRQLSPEPA